MHSERVKRRNFSVLTPFDWAYSKATLIKIFYVSMPCMFYDNTLKYNSGFQSTLFFLMTELFYYLCETLKVNKVVYTRYYPIMYLPRN